MGNPLANNKFFRFNYGNTDLVVSNSNFIFIRISCHVFNKTKFEGFFSENPSNINLVALTFISAGSLRSSFRKRFVY